MNVLGRIGKKVEGPLLGVLGWPIAHSLSPHMHNAAFEKLNLPWYYHAFAVPPEKLQTAIWGAASLGFLGLNLTIPHKEMGLAYCEPDEIAKQVGAVNTLRFEKDKIIGTNTDVYGFTKLCEASQISFDPAMRVLILGAGGAARAVIVACLQKGILPLVASRKPGILSFGNEQIKTIPLHQETLDLLLPNIDVLVDCTPRGLIKVPEEMELFTKVYPELTLSLLPAHACIFDLATQPETLLTQAAKRVNLCALSGRLMLLYQGVKALEFWLQEQIPFFVIKAMRDTLFPIM